MKPLAYLLGITLILSSLYISQSPNIHIPFIPDAKTTQADSVDLMGEAWSENIGWISFNCATTPAGCDGISDYKVTLDTATNNLTGFAWSEHIGWIEFGGNANVGCPYDINGHQPPCEARVENGELMGWAKAVAGDGSASVPVSTTTRYTTPTSGTNFHVPLGTTELSVKAWGAGGGSGASDGGTGLGGAGGGGGFATITNIPVTPEENVSIRVGGGGGGGPLPHGGAGGGGYSGVFRSATPLIIAGGGGGGGSSRNNTDLWGGAGGAGGGTNGGNGSVGISAYGSTPPDPDVSPGYGGSQIAGGTATNTTLTHQNVGLPGVSLAGGMGGANQDVVYGGGGSAGTNGGASGGPAALASWGGSGGGGGGGYFGGAGGGGGFTSPAGAGGGAGGGSGYVSITGTVTEGSGATPANTGDSSYVSGVGAGGAMGGAGAWNISSAIFSQVRALADDAFPYGIFFKPDGLKMYVVGNTGDEVNEYNLSTAWDVSTAAFFQRFSVATEDAAPTGLFFDSTGTKMYVLGNVGLEVNEYTLGTAWDIVTASFVRVASLPEDNEPDGIFFNPDGTKMYIVGGLADEVNEYNLSTGWDVSTRVFSTVFSIASEDTVSREVFFKPDGTKMFIVGGTADEVNEYALATPWSIATASLTRTFSVTTQNTNPTGIFFKPDGLRMYVTGQTAPAEVNQYNLGSGSGSSGGPGLVELTYNELVTPPSNGWDGWISLSSNNGGSGGTYGVEIGATELTGFAWGSDVVGWISFNCSNEEVRPCADSNYKVYFDTLPCVSPSYQCSTDNTQSTYKDAWCTETVTTCNVGEMCRSDMGSICGPGNPTGQLVFTAQRVRRGNTTQISWPTLAAYDYCRVRGTSTGGSTDSWNWSSSTPLINVTTSALQNEVTYTLECTQIGDVSATYQLLDTERVTILPSIKEI